MENLLFIAIVAFGLTLMLAWGFQHLPRENWQILATMPLQKTAGGQWAGVNFTFYGLFNAIACVAAASLVLMLLGSVGVSTMAVVALMAAVFAICIPASRKVAAIVEKKPATLTIGGASFVGLLILPGFVAGWNAAGLATPIPLLAVLAAFAIAFGFGEGLGRLACISFGCCYGRPVHRLPAAWQKWFAHAHFIFQGATKKIAYAGHLEGVAVVPIQAMTAVICCAAGLLSTALFLSGHFAAALVAALLITQLWRFASEFLRADFRGGGRLSAYQWMALAMAAYGLVLGLQLEPDPLPVAPRIADGLAAIWNPSCLLLLQVLGLLVFLWTGRSRVTASNISFHVVTDRI
jgi:prolipoprotein diacylglyceryltransferase